MITSLLSCCLSIGPKLIYLPSFANVDLGSPVTHLKSFFDARALNAGEASFQPVSAIQPVVQTLPFKPVLQTVVMGEVVSRQGLQRPALKPARVTAPIVSNSGLIAEDLLPKTVEDSAPRMQPSKPKPAGDDGKAPRTVETKRTDSDTQTPNNVPLEDMLVTLNFVNAPFNTIIDGLMLQTHSNLLVLADDKSKVTLKATNRRFIDTLSDLCAITSLGYLKVGNEYVIASDDKLKASYPDAYNVAHPAKSEARPVQFVTESYKTNYCDGNKLIEALKGNYKADELTMFAAPSQVSPTLDSQDESSKSGVNASVLKADQNSTAISRLVILKGTKEAVESAIALMKSMDVGAPQVNIAVTINDLNIDAEKQLGIDWTLPSTTFNEQQPSGINFASISRSPISFQASINALETKGKDKLLARPNIMVQDGQRAYILVGERLEFPIVESVQQNGQPLFSVDQERVGIYLQVSVWITNDGKVKLNLYPQVSTVSSFIQVNGGSYPQISTREAQTTLTVQSGNTIIIGGLMQDEDITNMQRVPILGQIPIFGELFTNRTHNKTRSEVIITITPTVVPNT